MSFGRHGFLVMTMVLFVRYFVMVHCVHLSLRRFNLLYPRLPPRFSVTHFYFMSLSRKSSLGVSFALSAPSSPSLALLVFISCRFLGGILRASPFLYPRLSPPSLELHIFISCRFLRGILQASPLLYLCLPPFCLCYPWRSFPPLPLVGICQCRGRIIYALHSFFVYVSPLLYLSGGSAAVCLGCQSA